MKQNADGSLIILNRSIVIGIIVLLTTSSFTFGYFVGRYSIKKSDTASAFHGGEESKVLEEEPKEILPSGNLSRLESMKEPDNKKVQEVTPSVESPQRINKTKSFKEETSKANVSRNEPMLKEGAYYLQVGAFKDISRALKLRDDLNKEQHGVIIKKEVSLHKVFVGPFKTRKDALLGQTRIKKLYSLNSIIVKQ